ncbi:MAG: asparagine synthase (glutamine-hydrolyzing) [Marinagarivorans sp.]|nr:asparagine synthase (glutamine-hydrolyzing) [Marinagarivorans sp.]
MCGIAFINAKKINEAERTRRMNDALALLKNRGPDDSGTYQHDRVAIGHARLAIIDVENSQQPMLTDDKRFIISFNGEIFNYKDLRVELKDEWDFKTGGDTEVILAGLILRGASFIAKMEGMWAFILWDTLTKSAIISRDRSGKKPLFFYNKKDELFCASEIPALQTLLKTPSENNRDGIADYFRYGFCLPGNTIYQDIKELPPATYATWGENQPLSIVRYWDCSQKEYGGSYAQAKLELRELLINAVKRRLVSDVEVGYFLSGGIDSTIVVALASQLMPKQSMKCFTLGFNNPSFDETPYAELIANKYDVQHFVTRLDNMQPERIARIYRERFGQPFADPSILPTQIICEQAAKYVKVALSGDGADELFGGYERYRGRKIIESYNSVPKFFQWGIESVINYFPKSTVHHSRSRLKKAQMFTAAYRRFLQSPDYIAPSYFSDKDFSECFPDLINAGHSLAANTSSKSSDSIKNMMNCDFRIYLPQSIHAKVDRASMSQSLEVRSPFMDTQVIEFAQSLPTDWLVDFRGGKKILKETFADLIPAQILHRKKQGFGIPIADWMKGRLGQELECLLERLNTHDVISKKGCLNLLRAHREGRADYAFCLWLIYGYLIWQFNQ